MSRIDSVLYRMHSNRVRTALRHWQRAYRAALRRGLDSTRAKRSADRHVFSLV